MNKTLRWILIAVIGVALVCLVVGTAFFVLRGAPQILNLGSRMMGPGQGIPRVMPPFNQNPQNPRGLAPFGPRRGFGGGFGGIFGVGFTLLRLAVPVFIVLLLILAAVLLLRRPAAQAPVFAPPAPTVQPAADEAPCPNCGRPVQAEWVACPYCGHRLRETL